MPNTKICPNTSFAALRDNFMKQHDVHSKIKISQRKTAKLGVTDKLNKMLTLESYLSSPSLT
jgi:hypothetical protein